MLKSHLRNNREPVSPINTFAGCKLNIKKPRTEPITMLPNIEISVKLYCIPIIVKQVIIIAETLDVSLGLLHKLKKNLYAALRIQTKQEATLLAKFFNII